MSRPKRIANVPWTSEASASAIVNACKSDVGGGGGGGEGSGSDLISDFVLIVAVSSWTGGVGDCFSYTLTRI